MCTSIEWCDSS